MGDFKKLKVWQKAHPMAVGIHRASGNIRASQHSHLKAQLVRAAFSVPANIVEGSGKQSQREFCRFLRISLNSANECEYHLIAARDTNALSSDEVAGLIDQVVEVRKMLFGFIEAIEAKRD
jgi:four helix bundle protein